MNEKIKFTLYAIEEVVDIEGETSLGEVEKQYLEWAARQVDGKWEMLEGDS